MKIVLTQKCSSTNHVEDAFVLVLVLVPFESFLNDTIVRSEEWER